MGRGSFRYTMPRYWSYLSPYYGLKPEKITYFLSIIKALIFVFPFWSPFCWASFPHAQSFPKLDRLTDLAWDQLKDAKFLELKQLVCISSSCNSCSFSLIVLRINCKWQLVQQAKGLLLIRLREVWSDKSHLWTCSTIALHWQKVARLKVAGYNI